MLNVYLVFSSQYQARWNIVGTSVPEVDALLVLKSTFDAMINKDYSFDVHVQRNQGVLQHVIEEGDFSIGAAIYMLQSNLSLNIAKTVGNKNKTLITNLNMKIFSNIPLKHQLLVVPMHPSVHQLNWSKGFDLFINEEKKCKLLLSSWKLKAKDFRSHCGIVLFLYVLQEIANKVQKYNQRNII